MNRSKLHKWQVLASRVVFANKWVRLREDRCQTNRGTIIDYYVVEKPDYALVVALDDEQRVILVRQYKHGCGEIIHELPAGYLEDGEDPLQSALRELQEETGYRAGQIRYLGTLHASPSALDCRAHVFLAQDLQPGLQRLDADEMIETELFDLDELVRAAAHNRILLDVSSVAALFMARERLMEEN